MKWSGSESVVRSPLYLCLWLPVVVFRSPLFVFLCLSIYLHSGFVLFWKSLPVVSCPASHFLFWSFPSADRTRFTCSVLTWPSSGVFLCLCRSLVFISVVSSCFSSCFSSDWTRIKHNHLRYFWDDSVLPRCPKRRLSVWFFLEPVCVAGFYGLTPQSWSVWQDEAIRRTVTPLPSKFFFFK